MYLFQPVNKFSIKPDVVTYVYNFGYTGGRGRNTKARDT